MARCPQCNREYPYDHTHCDFDGSLLIADARTIDIDMSGASLGNAAGVTAAERPMHRERVGRAGPNEGTAQFNTGTRVSAGTRVSLDTNVPNAVVDVRSAAARRRDDARLAAESRCGELLGSYRLQSVLGLGGMGAVYTAEHVKLGRQVALKLLHKQYATRRDAVVRFFQEAQAVNRIRHKNIVDVTDLVELPGGTVFIIMELLEGQSLGSRLRRVGLLGLGPTISVMIQICDALSAAHAQNVVHRDLKPDNIFLTNTDEGDLLVKLLDFGVAKLVGDKDVGVKTAVGAVVGTPAFMSPEQAAGFSVDHRSDIYSLGAIMYQLFTGQHLFRGRSFAEYVKLHMIQEPVPPRQTPGGAAMDPQLESIIIRCLQKSPEARFQTAAELRVALVEYFELYAANIGGSVEGESGIYRLSSIDDVPAGLGSVPLFATPPATIPSGPMHLRPIDAGHPETALMIGDLPSSRSSTKRRHFIIGTAGFVAIATVVAASVFLSRGNKTAKNERVPDQSASSATATTATAPIATAPAKRAIDAGAKPAPPRTIRLESNVLAQVFEDGSESARCGTPCALQIETGGDAPAERVFVVRASGYGDGAIRVRRDDNRTLYSVDLERDEDPATTEGNDKTRPPDTKRGGSSSGTSKSKPSQPSKPSDAASKERENGEGNQSKGAAPEDKTLDPFKKKN